MTGESYFAEPADAEITIGHELITQGQLIERFCINSVAQRIQLTKIRKVEWTDISGDGYTASLYRIVLRLVGENDYISFIFKSFCFPKVKLFVEEFFGIIMSEIPADQRMLILRDCGAVHDAECTVYSLFNKHDCTVPNLHLPLAEIYDVEKISFDENEIPRGFILMEDLTVSCCNVNIIEGLSETQIRRVVDEFIHFHAALLCDKNENARWKTEIHEGNLMVKTVQRNHESFKKQLKGGCDKSAMFTLFQRLEKVMLEEFENMIQEKILKEPGVPALVCHGDMWTCNLLWKRRDDKPESATDELVAIIDWQMCHRGNPMADFARIIALSCQNEVRQRVDAWIVSYYYNELAAKTAPQGVQLGFSVKDLQRAYEYAKVVQAAFNPLLIEPLHRSFVTKCGGDMKLATEQTDDLISRALVAMRDAERFLVENAPEWLTELAN